MVNAVAEKHPGFAVDARPAGEHKQEIGEYGLGSHGVVCVGSTGIVLWKHAGHDLSKEALDAGVTKVLAALDAEKPDG